MKFAVLRSLLTVAASSSSSAKHSSRLQQKVTHLLNSMMIQTMFPTFFLDLASSFVPTVYPHASNSSKMH